MPSDLLRAMDPTGVSGSGTPPDALLAQARERTRGYPRALEALAAILAADRDTTLPELLAETERLPENVVEALVGEAFNRLDPLAQQVMQALAIYPVPVPPVAVDYLLQPFQPAIDSAPVLARLVNMQFVRRDAGHYYLHQVDRDYALQPHPRRASPATATPSRRRSPATRCATGRPTTSSRPAPRATIGRPSTTSPPSSPSSSCAIQADDYDTAAQVLLDIDVDYLHHWGHYRLRHRPPQRAPRPPHRPLDRTPPA